MGVLTKYDRIEPNYLPQSVVTYIYLHPVRVCVCVKQLTHAVTYSSFSTVRNVRHLALLR
jgi:hypothetical protein